MYLTLSTALFHYNEEERTFIGNLNNIILPEYISESLDHLNINEITNIRLKSHKTNLVKVFRLINVIQKNEDIDVEYWVFIHQPEQTKQSPEYKLVIYETHIWVGNMLVECMKWKTK